MAHPREPLDLQLDHLHHLLRACSGTLPTPDHLKRLYPRARYWDALATELGPRAIHYRDVPALLRVRPADSAHFDYRDKVAFTAALLEELERRGMRFD